jgi:hypothetical protein
MPFSHNLKVFWFTPIRTASRSCNKLQEHLKFTDLYSHNFPETQLEREYFFISNIRNPYSRVVSIYYLYCFHSKKNPDNFGDWVVKRLQQEVEVPSSRLEYQINLSSIYSEYKKFPDYFVRVENFEDDIRNLWFVKENMSDEVEKIIKETIVNNSYSKEFGNRLPWQEYYNNSLSNDVYNFLEKDFLLFGYDKNSWKNGTS